jgi:hypothetical protein
MKYVLFFLAVTFYGTVVCRAQTENPIDRTIPNGSTNSLLYRQTDPAQQPHVVPRKGNPEAKQDAEIEVQRKKAQAARRSAELENQRAAEAKAAAQAVKKKLDGMKTMKGNAIMAMGADGQAKDADVQKLLSEQKQQANAQALHENRAAAHLKEAKQLEQGSAYSSHGDFPYGTSPRTGR